MPYIPKDNRKELEQLARQVISRTTHLGELNYFITVLLDIGLGFVSYNSINSVIGLLECVKLEFYRRLAANYEDKKCRENGEVFRKR